jgi:hypothetical protein
MVLGDLTLESLTSSVDRSLGSQPPKWFMSRKMRREREREKGQIPCRHS